jgi:hypothetical protein
MSPAPKTIRMIASSFAAGAGAMALVSLIGAVAVKGGLEVHNAQAEMLQGQSQPNIDLDVKAVRAQLALADQTMAAARAKTAHAMTRLERLSGG